MAGVLLRDPEPYGSHAHGLKVKLVRCLVHIAHLSQKLEPPANPAQLIPYLIAVEDVAVTDRRTYDLFGKIVGCVEGDPRYVLPYDGNRRVKLDQLVDIFRRKAASSFCRR